MIKNSISQLQTKIYNATTAQLKIQVLFLIKAKQFQKFHYIKLYKQKLPESPTAQRASQNNFPLQLFLFSSLKSLLYVHPVRKSLFLVIFLKKNRELYVNLTILAGFFAITRLKAIAEKFRMMEKTRLDEFYIYVDKNFLLK